MAGQTVTNKHTLKKYVNSWTHYNGSRRDFDLALDLMTTRYAPLRANHDMKSYSFAESARYQAEESFFNDASESVQDLMEDMVHQRYRNASFAAPSRVDLRGRRARHVISAARLFQQKVITLSDCDSAAPPRIGLPVARQSYQFAYGPMEGYLVGMPGIGRSGKVKINMDHRTESLSAPQIGGVHPERLGSCYVHQVGAYENIVEELEIILDAFHGDQNRLADLFIQFARSNRFYSPTPQLRFPQRRALARISFLILEMEQSQWQSACFFSGTWRLGLSVSFARLIRLFKNDVIGICELFEKYPLYSTKNILNNNARIRDTCRKIDNLFLDEYGGKLNRDRALRDLVFLYGNGGSK